jgi:hypothetical protein
VRQPSSDWDSLTFSRCQRPSIDGARRMLSTQALRGAITIIIKHEMNSNVGESQSLLWFLS